jgi:hypothetical protein
MGIGLVVGIAEHLQNVTTKSFQSVVPSPESSASLPTFTTDFLFS